MPYFLCSATLYKMANATSTLSTKYQPKLSTYIRGSGFAKKFSATARRNLFVAFWVREVPYKIWARSHHAHASACAREFYYIHCLVELRHQTKNLYNFWTLWDFWLKFFVESPNVSRNLYVKFEPIQRPLIFRPYLLLRPNLIGRALACALSEGAQT